ncbi:DUF805 domain-containing protein [Sphingomonas sp. IC081]|uniref:DUF805 domain-containing protein n=1 Tax=Sphingomonas sp. IC081 TaxID=304378 RepID=UPI00115B91ED|nr:DUF805 domain-containing protein [Sphingomonas sp. IC081]QDK32756.1 DUF805 domain-containing protein [Sphingomonas sp. IC081]
MKDKIRSWLHLALQTLQGTFSLQGRSARSEVIGWFVLVTLLNAVLLAIASLLLSGAALAWTQFAIPAATTLPALALFVRRMHDIGLRGWWSLPLVIVGFKNLALDAISQTAGWGLRGNIEAVTRYLDWALLPAFAFAYLLVLVAPGTSGGNRFGPNPRLASTDAAPPTSPPTSPPSAVTGT